MSDDSDAETEGKKSTRALAKGKKKARRACNETLAQLPQSTGVSMAVYSEYDGAELLEQLTERQEKTLLSLFAYVKHLPKAEKNNAFLECLEQMQVEKSLLDQVTRCARRSSRARTRPGSSGNTRTQ